MVKIEYVPNGKTMTMSEEQAKRYVANEPSLWRIVSGGVEQRSVPIAAATPAVAEAGETEPEVKPTPITSRRNRA